MSKCGKHLTTRHTTTCTKVMHSITISPPPLTILRDYCWTKGRICCYINSSRWSTVQWRLTIVSIGLRTTSGKTLYHRHQEHGSCLNRKMDHRRLGCSDRLIQISHNTIPGRQSELEAHLNSWALRCGLTRCSVLSQFEPKIHPGSLNRNWVCVNHQTHFTPTNIWRYALVMLLDIHCSMA